MKLRTTMDGTFGESIAMSSPGGFQENLIAIEHDAAAAHSLMQAIQEFRQDAFGGEPYEILDAVEERASELMREWGFDSGEGL